MSLISLPSKTEVLVGNIIYLAQHHDTQREAAGPLES